ncbi:MAG: hypothetical protein HY690_13830 [Chloroflexi bacterium]|nr:hypothetical protein [Chloroflexota bacterium]
MELTNDPRQAEVVIIYLLNLGKALLVDKRRRGPVEPWIEALPQQELLLEGKSIQAPLTHQLVHLIERRQMLPADQRLMQSYFGQLLEALAFRLQVLRPTLPTVERLSLGPHFAPVALLAASDLWRGLLREFQERGEEGAEHQARAKMRELYAYEVLRRERVDAEELALLRQDFREQQVFRSLTL